MSYDLRKGSDGVQKKIKGCLWLTLGLIILEVKAGNELAISLPAGGVGHGPKGIMGKK